eukprot:tig00000361_g24366.t1
MHVASHSSSTSGSVLGDHVILHPSVKREAAEALGIRMLREHINSVVFMDNGKAPLAFKPSGPKIELTTAIKNDLRDYLAADKSPYETLLKEKMQNADDAGAKEVCFVLDRCSYGEESLLVPELRECQGPALLVYNDAVFTEADFEAIERLASGTKAGDASKIGAFNRGFNIVYKFCDVVEFLSGTSFAIFDPHQRYLPRRPGCSERDPGCRWEDIVKIGLAAHLRDQFAPLYAYADTFGISATESFPGTLFRIPLRSAKQAATSKICPNERPLDPNTVFYQLRAAFRRLGPTMLLFLRNVECIRLLERRTPGEKPHTVGKVWISTPTGKPPLDVLRRPPALAAATQEGTWHIGEMIVTSEFGSEHAEEATWLVCNRTPDERQRNELLKLAKAGRALAPWAGVAGLVGTRGRTHRLQTSSAAMASVGAEIFSQTSGGLFCFLPVPGDTGLPVLLNAGFELSSDRRDLLTGQDHATQHAVLSPANAFLCEELLPAVYARYLVELAARGDPQIVLSHWPGYSTQAMTRYKPLCQNTLKFLFDLPVLPRYSASVRVDDDGSSSSGPGRGRAQQCTCTFVEARKSIFWARHLFTGLGEPASSTSTSTAKLSAGRTSYLNSCKAVLDCLTAVGELLVEDVDAGLPGCGETLASLFTSAQCHIKWLTPSIVRDWLRSKQTSGLARAHLQAVPFADRRAVFSYCISDLEFRSTEHDCAELRAELVGCPLALLEGGTVAVLQEPSSSTPTHWVVNKAQRCLFSAVQQLAFVHSDLGGSADRELSILVNAGLNVRALEPSALLQLLAEPGSPYS